MPKRAEGELRRALAVRVLLTASFVALCLSHAVGGPGVFAQPGQRGREQQGERGRERVKTRPRTRAAAGGRRMRPPPQARAQLAEISLWIISNPPRSKVSVDGSFRGETDAEGELEVRLPPGSYFVRVSRDGYMTREGEIEVSSEMGEQEVEFTLPLALTTLNVTTDPPEAEVYLDDVYKGTSNASGLLVIERVNPTQPHTLRVSKEGYQQHSMPLNSPSGQISVKLVSNSVRLRVTTDPPEAEVYLDGVYKGTSTSDGLLLIEQVNPNQTHTLRAKRGGYTEQTAAVPHNSTEVAVKLAPDPVVLLARSVKQNVAQGRLGAAYAEYERLAASAPEHQELPRLLESILQSLNARSAAALQRVGPYGLAAAPKEIEELAGLYEQARRWGGGDESVDEMARYWAMKQLLVVAEQSPSAAEREGLLRRARAALSEFGGRGLRNANLIFDLGWGWLRLGDKAAALKSFKQAQELRPDWAYTHFALATLAMSEAEAEVNKSAKVVKYSQAIEGFTKAVELKHDFARAYALRAIAYGVLNRREEAVASGLQAVALDRRSAYAHFALGFAYFQKGKPGYRNARDEYREALSLGGTELDDATKDAIQQKLAIIARVIKN
jgi:hypothetical protein